MATGPEMEGIAAPPPDTARALAAGRGRAAETERLYQTDWRAFTAWCGAVGLASLPAAPATVAGFLAATPRLSAAR